MSLAKPATIPLRFQQHVVFDNVPWEFYEHLLRVVGDRPIRITYYRGKIEIMSPLAKHETWKKRIARLLEMMTYELRIDMEPLGSTTFRRKGRRVGLEPDECYFIRNATAIRGKDRLNLKTDPPPDLAIEIDITRRSIPRQPIYAALGVPELWRFDGKRISVLELSEGRTYHQREGSISFPFLPMAEFAEFVQRLKNESSLVVLQSFQQWVRTLKR